MEFKPSGNVGVVIEPPKQQPFNNEGLPVFRPGQIPVIQEVIEPRRGPVNQWSMSTLFNFEQCPHKVFLGKVQKIPGKKGDAAARGILLHEIGENYVQGKEWEGEADEEGFPTAFKKFKSSMKNLRREFEEGNVEVEGEWAYDLEWNITSWVSKETWSRHKLDVLLREGNTSAVVIDYKSGKKFGNEVKHSQQGLDYAIATLMRYQELEFIRVEFWYIDTGETLVNTYTREQAMLLLPGLEKRARRLTSALEFPPKASKHNCRFCDYVGGACEWGID